MCPHTPASNCSWEASKIKSAVIQKGGKSLNGGKNEKKGFLLICLFVNFVPSTVDIQKREVLKTSGRRTNREWAPPDYTGREGHRKCPSWATKEETPMAGLWAQSQQVQWGPHEDGSVICPCLALCYPRAKLWTSVYSEWRLLQREKSAPKTKATSILVSGMSLIW